MDGEGPNEDTQLVRLKESFLLAVESSEPDLDELESLATQARALTYSGNERIAAEAQSLELRVIGVVLACRAMALRHLAQRLQILAQMLPPSHPERN